MYTLQKIIRRTPKYKALITFKSSNIMANKKIEDLSIEELKAKAYDIMANIEQGQRMLQGVNQLINKKNEPQKQEPKPVKSK